MLTTPPSCRPSKWCRQTIPILTAIFPTGAAPVEYGGTSYCPGSVFAVRRTLYGVDTRIVLRGVVVESVTGSQVQVAGGPSCLPTEWCGQTISEHDRHLPDRGGRAGVRRRHQLVRKDHHGRADTRRVPNDRTL